MIKEFRILKGKVGMCRDGAYYWFDVDEMKQAVKIFNACTTIEDGELTIRENMSDWEKYDEEQLCSEERS